MFNLMDICPDVFASLFREMCIYTQVEWLKHMSPHLKSQMVLPCSTGLQYMCVTVMDCDQILWENLLKC